VLVRPVLVRPVLVRPVLVRRARPRPWKPGGGAWGAAAPPARPIPESGPVIAVRRSYCRTAWPRVDARLVRLRTWITAAVGIRARTPLHCGKRAIRTARAPQAILLPATRTSIRGHEGVRTRAFTTNTLHQLGFTVPAHSQPGDGIRRLGNSGLARLRHATTQPWRRPLRKARKAAFERAELTTRRMGRDDGPPLNRIRYQRSGSGEQNRT